jgi:hypothetical protein
VRVAQPVLVAAEDGVLADRLDQGPGKRLGGRQREVLEGSSARRRGQLADPFAQGVLGALVELRQSLRLAPSPPLRVAARRVARASGDRAAASSSASPAATSRAGSARRSARPRSPHPFHAGRSRPWSCAGGARTGSRRAAAPRRSARARPSSGSGSRRARRGPRWFPGPWSTRRGARLPCGRRSRHGSCAATSAAGCRGRRPGPRLRPRGPEWCGGGRPLASRAPRRASCPPAAAGP